MALTGVAQPFHSPFNLLYVTPSPPTKSFPTKSPRDSL